MHTSPKRDAVDTALRHTARQGSILSRVAHLCATLLIVLFSAGALVALSGDALTHILAIGLTPASIPYAVSAAVSTFLVGCMDVAMLYAAGKLRQLRIRRADRADMWGHVAILAVACVLEAATYIYMAGRYDPPASAVGWLLVAARAGAAPLFGVYLSMASPLPVGPRDILYQAELAAGAGMIRDVITAANNPDAPLAEKLALFGASAVMTDGDRERLGHMIDVLTQTTPRERLLPPDAIVETTIEPVAMGEAEDGGGNDTPPRGRGIPRGKARGRTPAEPAAIKLVPYRNDTRTFDDLRAMGLGLLEAKPDMTQTELRKTLSCRNDTAAAIMTVWRNQRGNATREDVG
jgi:hypothetical protein